MARWPGHRCKSVLHLTHRDASRGRGAISQHGRGDAVDVLGRHAPCEEAVAPMPDDLDGPIDLPARLLRRQTETPRLRQEVVDACRATVVADCHRQVPPLQADHRCGKVIVGRSGLGAGPPQAFFAWAVHQPLLDTCLPANSGQGPLASPALPPKSAQLPHAAPDRCLGSLAVLASAT